MRRGDPPPTRHRFDPRQQASYGWCADFIRGVTRASGNKDSSVGLARVGVSTERVPAPSWNVKITTADDWVVAQALWGHAEAINGRLSATTTGPAWPAQSP